MCAISIRKIPFAGNITSMTRPRDTCHLVELDLSLEIPGHVVAEVTDAVLLEVLDLGEDRVRDYIGTAMHRL